MKRAMQDMANFHMKFDLKYIGPPRSLPPDLYKFRSEFMEEELAEFREAWHNQDIEKQFDALIDLCYVAIGTAYLMGGGIDISPANRDKYQPMWSTMWRDVHEANMRKVRAVKPSESKRGSTYDVVKPSDWVGPDFKRFLETAYRRTNNDG